MKCFLPAILFLAARAFAQTDLVYDPLAFVGSFLQLTDTQMKAIRLNNAEFDDWVDGKWTRIEELYDEIDQEIRRDVPDPNTIGVRFVDIEYIYREIDAREAEICRQNVALLTEPQKVRLELLEAAAKLEPLAYAAWSVSLLNPDELDAGLDVTGARQTSGRRSPKTRIRPGFSLAPERAGRLRKLDRRWPHGRVTPQQQKP